MFKAIREQFWYIQAFLKKYSVQIISSSIITLVVAVALNIFVARLPKAKQEYKIGLVGQYSSTQLPQIVSSFINGGLVKLDDQLEPKPNIAEKWTVTENDTLYTFYLKPNLTWNDGHAVKASDIKITIPSVKVDLLDPNITTFKLPSKFSPFPSLLTFPLVSKTGKIISEYDIKIKQKTSGVITQISLESKERKILFNFFPTAKQVFTSYKLGELDLVAQVPETDIDPKAKNFGSILRNSEKSQVVMLLFNQADPVMKDKSLRQGIAYGIEDKGFGYEPATTTINPDSWAFNPLVKTYNYNPARSKELIKSATNLELSVLPELLPVAEKIKTQLEKGLVNISIKVVTSTPDQFQLFLTNYIIPNDPDQYRDWHSTQSTNLGKNSDEKIDKYLEDGRTAFDQKDRKQLYLDFQRAFSEELPALVLYHPGSVSLARNQLYFDIIKSIQN